MITCLQTNSTHLLSHSLWTASLGHTAFMSISNWSKQVKFHFFSLIKSICHVMRTSGKKNHESVLRFCRSYYTLWSLFSPPLNSPSRTAWWFMTHTSFWFQTQLSNIKRILHMTKWLTTEGWKTRGKKETDWTTIYYQKRERGNWNVSHSRVTKTTDTTGQKHTCIMHVSLY